LQSFLTTPALRYLIASGNDVGDHLRLFAQDFKNDPWVQYTVGDLQAIADRDAMVAMVGAAFGGPMRANSRVVEACNRLGWSRYLATTGGDIQQHIKSLVADYAHDEELPWMQRAMAALDKVREGEAAAIVDTVDRAFKMCQTPERVYRGRLGVIR
jgi:hypothetical protein